MNRIFTVILAGLFLSITATACTSVNSETTETKSGVQENAVTGTPSGEGSNKPEYLTVETFKEKIWNYEKNPQEWVYEGSEPVIIDFYADWCKPCKMVAPILEEISQDYAGKVKVYKIDTEKQKELAAVFQVSSIPTFLYIPAKGQPQMDKGYKDKATFERIIKEILLVE
ncbi:MAG: thioredoxin [Bacteroidales bacterium]|nr:thioredoxin [Bacteroidales bacterium]